MEDQHWTGFTYDLSLVEKDPNYEWLPEPDESGRTIYKPHKIIKIQNEFSKRYYRLKKL